MRTLILFAHPRMSASIVQRQLQAALGAIAGITVHDLYAAYPDMMIDRRREQALLLEHDLIVFQHPFYWYSSPAIIKEWQDIVLDFGWAYGPGGDKLHGKHLMNIISTGGAEGFYTQDGRNRHSIEQFLAPFNQTAHLCGMAYLKPFVVYEGRKLETGRLAHQVADCAKHVEDLVTGRRNPLKTLADGYQLPSAFKLKVRA